MGAFTADGLPGFGLYACAQDKDAIRATDKANNLELELGLRNLALLMSSHAGAMVTENTESAWGLQQQQQLSS